jgi:hypothetical protein
MRQDEVKDFALDSQDQLLGRKFVEGTEPSPRQAVDAPAEYQHQLAHEFPIAVATMPDEVQKRFIFKIRRFPEPLRRMESHHPTDLGID